MQTRNLSPWNFLNNFAGDVNTKEQTFKAEVLIEARWSGAPGEEFDPQLVVTNLEESKNEKKWLTKKVYSDYGDGRKREHNTLSWRFKGCFYENMELKNFPRDVSHAWKEGQKTSRK